MASMHTGTDVAAPPRVRDQARSALAVMVFSAGVSIAVTLALLLLAGLGE